MTKLASSNDGIRELHLESPVRRIDRLLIRRFLPKERPEKKAMEAMAQEERHDLLLRMKRNDGGQSHSTTGKLGAAGDIHPRKMLAQASLKPES